MTGEHREGLDIIYPYQCGCGHDWEVIKSVKEIDHQEVCLKCGKVGERYIATSQSFYGAGDWDTAHYNPAFGRVMKSNGEARAEAKKLGWAEVGTECAEKTLDTFEKDREKKIQSGYDSINMNLGDIR